MTRGKPIIDVDDNVLQGCSEMNNEDKLFFENWMEYLTCMEVVGRDLKIVIVTLNWIPNMKKQAIKLNGGTIESKIWELESFIGSSASEQIEILPSKKSNTKGGKRIRGRIEEVEKQQKKTVCRACGEEGNHYCRNYPSKVIFSLGL